MLEETDKYIKYLEAKLIKAGEVQIELEARMLCMIRANKGRSVSYTLDEANSIINSGGEEGC